MGHCDSSAQFGGGGALRASGSGTGAPAARPAAEDLSRGARALLFFLGVYQSFFSALMPSACKFYPSCSRYAVEAVHVHGARRGAWLAIRAAIVSAAGLDLVPEAPDFSRNPTHITAEEFLDHSRADHSSPDHSSLGHPSPDHPSSEAGQ